MGSPNKEPAEWRAPPKYKEFSALDDAGFTIGGGLLLLAPLLIVGFLVWLFFF